MQTTINPENLRVLPKDILGLLVYYLDPEIKSLLDKKSRDSYFRENSIKIWIGLPLKNLRTICRFLDKYSYIPIKLILYGYSSLTESLKKLSKNVTKLIDTYILDLPELLKLFPNLEEIEGLIRTTTDNLRAAKGTNYDLRFIVDTNDQVDMYKKILPEKNIHAVCTHCFLSHNMQLSGLEKYITAIPAILLKNNTGYPNLRGIAFCHDMQEYAMPDLDLPKLTTVRFNCTDITPGHISLILQKYKTAEKLLMSGRITDGENYDAFASFPITIHLPHPATLFRLVKFEKLYRERTPNYVSNKTLVLDKRTFTSEMLEKLSDFKIVLV